MSFSLVSLQTATSVMPPEEVPPEEHNRQTADTCEQCAAVSLSLYLPAS